MEAKLQFVMNLFSPLNGEPHVGHKMLYFPKYYKEMSYS